jgi:hypothetical protein
MDIIIIWFFKEAFSHGRFIGWNSSDVLMSKFYSIANFLAVFIGSHSTTKHCQDPPSQKNFGFSLGAFSKFNKFWHIPKFWPNPPLKVIISQTVLKTKKSVCEQESSHNWCGSCGFIPYGLDGVLSATVLLLPAFFW